MSELIKYGWGGRNCCNCGLPTKAALFFCSDRFSVTSNLFAKKGNDAFLSNLTSILWTRTLFSCFDTNNTHLNKHCPSWNNLQNVQLPIRVLCFKATSVMNKWLLITDELRVLKPNLVYITEACISHAEDCDLFSFDYSAVQSVKAVSW